MIEINNKKLCENCFSETAEDVCPFCGHSGDECDASPVFLPVGSRLNGSIIIGRVIGKGGFGITYLGYDVKREKTVAVKEYYPNDIACRSKSGTRLLASDERYEEDFKNGADKFYNEAEMSALFNGENNIVSVLDHFRENNTVYMIMEYLNGITLKRYIKACGKLSDGQGLFIMDKITESLAAVHGMGVLHRDISPDNIMICADGNVRLIDFGAARQTMKEGSSDLTVLMKPRYTPIEQYTKKGRQGAWTDIYSLGVSVYYALTGTVIDDPYMRMDKDSEFTVNRHGINNELWKVLRKCTMIRSSDRYRSAAELKEALSAVSASLKAETVIFEAETFQEERQSSSSVSVTGSETISIAERIRKNKLAAAVCSAAAIFIVGAACFAAGLSDRSDSTAEYAGHDISDAPDKVIVPLNCEYPGDWNMISSSVSKDVMSSFKGDIKVTLDAEVGYTDEFDGYFNFRPVNSRGELVPISDINGMANNIDDDFPWYSMGARIDQVNPSFVISQEDIEALDSDGLSFMVNNININSVTFEDASGTSDPRVTENTDGSVTVKMNDEYFGALRWGYAGIFPDVLGRFDGDVKITLRIREYQYEALESMNGPGYSHELCIDNHYSSDIVNISAENIGAEITPDGTHVILGNGVDEFSFVVSHSEIEKAGQCLGFRGHNLIVESARIENYLPAENKVSADARSVSIELSDMWYGRKGYISKDDLEFPDGGDVRITIEFEGKKTVNSIDTMDISFLSQGGYIFVDAENSGPAWYADVYSLGRPGCGLDRFTFILTKEQIAGMDDTGMEVVVANMEIKDITIEPTAE